MQLLSSKFDFTTWIASPVRSYAAVAQNLIFDQHVSIEREQVFNRFLEQANGDCGRAVVEYYAQRVRDARYPDYSDHALNGRNIFTSGSMPVGPASVGGMFISNALALARVLNLSRLGTVFQWAKESGFSEFEFLPTAVTHEEVGKWLDSKLLDCEESSRTIFIAALLDALNEFPRLGPVWATTLESIAPYALAGADRWAEVSGMDPGAPGAWIMVLSYSVSDVEHGTLARPTVLDAGWSPYFFPTPPAAEFGYAIDLAAKRRHYKLIPEVIHGRISHKIEHWERTGRMLDRTKRWNGVDLDTQRRVHYEILQCVYGETITAWIPPNVFVAA